MCVPASFFLGGGGVRVCVCGGGGALLSAHFSHAKGILVTFLQ